MGLFLSPFSGHAVGGGGHGVIDPPPSGIDPLTGPRSEVDTVNRTPLRLLRTTMAKHQPKFMKVVPPGQQRGTIAPPYAWDALERPDWRYELPNRSKLRLGEAEFSPPGASTGRPKAPTTTPHRAVPKPAQRDPRHARVAQIQAELRQLRQEVQQLMSRQHALVQQGKSELRQGPASRAPQGHWKGSGDSPPQHWGPTWTPTHRSVRSEALSLNPLKLIEGDYTPFGIHRREGDPPRPSGEGAKSINPDPREPDVLRREFMRQRRAALGMPLGLEKKKSAPSQSPEIIQIHQQVAQKRQRIAQLTQELKQLRQQMKSHMESAGLTVNNLSRMGLLLR